MPTSARNSDNRPPAEADSGQQHDDAFADIPHLTYEDARDQLVGIVATLEGGQAGLEESMTLWERGEALAAHCTAWLDRADESVAARTPES